MIWGSDHAGDRVGGAQSWRRRLCLLHMPAMRQAGPRLADLLRLCYRITIRHHRRRNAGFIVKQAALDRGSVAPQASYSVADKRFSHDHLECNYEEARESVAVESGRSTSIFIHGQFIHPFRYWKEGARLGAEQCSSTRDFDRAFTGEMSYFGGKALMSKKWQEPLAWAATRATPCRPSGHFLWARGTHRTLRGGESSRSTVVSWSHINRGNDDRRKSNRD